MPEAVGAAGRLAGWARRLRLADVPPRVVAHAHSQILSELAAVRASGTHSLGRRLMCAFGRPDSPDPKQTAYVLAALGICLDFDDTAYAGHLSHSCVTVPIAYSRQLHMDGAAVLTAVVAANEVAARITAAATLGPFRGQLAAHTHIAGAVIARLRAVQAPEAFWAPALGLGFALPPWPLDRACLGSEAKALVAAVPVRTGLDAVDAALAGIAGPADILEHPDGFLARFADVPLADALLLGLGERWHTETLSYKVHPGSAYISAAVDCAIRLHQVIGQPRAAEIAEVEVSGSLLTVGIERQAGAYLCGSRSPVAALNYSVGYNVATALLTGALTVADLDAERVADSERWSLAARVRVEHDPALTAAALLGTAPLGEAVRQAGARALPWLLRQTGSASDRDRASTGSPPGASAGSGTAAALEHAVSAAMTLGPSQGFATARKAVGARIRVRLLDGRSFEAFQEVAVGAVGGAEHAEHAALARRKYVGNGGDARVADRVLCLDELTAVQTTDLVTTVLRDVGH